MQGSAIPFCGLPPVPAEIWQRWILEPTLIACLALAFVMVLHRARGRWRGLQLGAFAAGWAVLLVALVSPLCALSVALFSMRATQHMLLLVVAAPLIALARPQQLLPGWRRVRLRRLARHPLVASAPTSLFAVLLWMWHVPSVYEATFTSDVAYWAMHLTLLGSVLPLWLQLLGGSRDDLLLRSLFGFATFVQMGVLGAVITLSPQLLYGVHATTTLAWGIQPLADQQLGGLIMWVPGCTVFLVAVLAGIYRGLGGSESAARSMA